ncbi:MAG: prenyltransferase/squalene oxidase repeat-containing protein [Lentisphaeria bacterium]
MSAEEQASLPDPVRQLHELTQADIDAVLEDYRKRQMIEHLMGPIISAVLHLVLVVLMMFFLVSPAAKKGDEVEVTMEELKIKEIDPKVIKDLQNLPDQNEVPPVERPDVPVEAEATTENFSNDMAKVENVDLTAVMDLKANPTPLRIAGLYSGRTGKGRGDLGRRYGANTVTEMAVLRALRWLKEHQNPDGSWSSSQPAAMGGLGLLTFLAHGEKPDSQEFGLTVKRAMQYLCNWLEATKADPAPNSYVHGIVTYAVAEAYGMTKLPYLKPAMEIGIAKIVAGQQAGGGFDYNYAKTPRWDTSVTGWQIQALKAAFIAGSETPGVLEAIEKAATFLKKTAYKGGKFGYSAPGEGSAGVTGVGTLCLQLIGDGAAAEAQAGVDFIRKTQQVKWADTWNDFNIYGWYYMTQAMIHAGSGPWKKWNDVFSSELTRNQKVDGHWESVPTPPGQKGSANVGECGPYYNTTFACLMLQVYYRYLPTYKMPKAVTPTTSALDLSDEKDSGALKIE